MSDKNLNLNVLDLEIFFRNGADMERAKIAAELVEERYAEQKSRSRGAQSKDILLTFLALGLADELLQMKMKREKTEARIAAILAKLKKSP